MTKILLVEDDQKITLALGIRLKAMGYEVIGAPDAVHAMNQAVKSQPDLVLLDINLPGGDGFLVAERLRNAEQTARTPIIFITASKREDFRERAAELGATGFLEKPFEARALTDMIEQSLSGSAGYH